MLTYQLPREFIAQRPVEPRDACRLLVLARSANKISHQVFRDLPQFLRPHDCLVLNDTKVLPARLYGKRAPTGGKVELLLLEEKGKGVFRCLGKPGKGLKPGARIFLNGARHKNGNGARHPWVGEVLSACGQERIVRFTRPSTSSGRTEEASSGRTEEASSGRTEEASSGRTEEASSGRTEEETLFQLGEIPLPPYIDRPVVPEDAQWYQTVYAREPGAIAAPTAGLHFTEELLDQIRQQGVQIAFVTLHVGWGTFKPVSEEEMESGRLHEERFSLSSEAAEMIHRTKANGGRVIAVGTTVVRALEACAAGPVGRESGPLPCSDSPRPSPNDTGRVCGTARGSRSGSAPATRGLCLASSREGTTDLFIKPPYEFKVVDALITNFHLPGTSLLLLVVAFAGEEKIMDSYQEAIRERYRFYSYGDAMFIF